MNKDIIKTHINDFKETHLSQNFKWRLGQKEAIIQIIETYYEGTYKTVILDAPTGSGKSIIALCSSWIFNKINKKSYILTSEISLQDQYEKDIKNYSLNYGSVKGIDNYICIDNDEKHSLGTCKIRNIHPKKMYCYDDCPYFIARNIASDSDSTILNYAYWIISQNYVNKNISEPIFPPRSILFCDEAHKILDIVQNHYSPRFDENTLDKIEKLKDFFKLHHVRDHTINYLDIKDIIANIWKEENQEKLSELLVRLEEILEMILPSVKVLKDKVNKEYPNESPPKTWRKALRIADWLKDFHCKIEDYNTIIEMTSSRNIVKNPQSDDELLFNCLEENYMMHKYFHKWSDFTILMSATFSDPSVYLRNIALNSAKYIKVNNSFDFSKSPIYFYNKRKMSYKHIEDNLPWLYKTINEILDKHPGENGIIHTASYHLAMKINNNLSKANSNRVLVYSGTNEKRRVLDVLKTNRNKVLMGPSLTHGLDLGGDMCRFIITAKIPYPSLGDRFVKTKMQINPEWYQWKTIIDLLQGSGRAIRSEIDWAITYILDGSLADLIHRNRKAFPPEFLNRFISINE